MTSFIKLTITKYILIVYESRFLGELNANKYFSFDECNIISIGTINIWLLGIIDNYIKEFRLAPAINRDQNTLRNFIEKHVKKVTILLSMVGRGMII